MADPERSAVESVDSGTGLITNPISGVASVEAPSNIGTVYSTHWAEAASQQSRDLLEEVTQTHGRARSVSTLGPVGQL